MKIIKLPICGIIIELSENENGYSGTIESDLIEPCPNCGEIGCYGHCEESEETEDEIDERYRYNNKVNVIESFILSCACAGIDVESSAFLDAIETTIDKCLCNC